MPLHHPQNQYQGVNAHLHSYYQAKGGWQGFHGQHITFLTGLLNRRLPEGYVADSEQSLQVRETHPDTGEKIRRRPEPDLLIYQHPAYQVTKPTPEFALAEPTFQDRLLHQTDLNEDLHLRAIRIFEIAPDQTLGKPVTHIELLSPTNKYPNDGYTDYREKRLMVLQSGLNLVEIDYLHETDPIISDLPSYRRGESGAYPYYILVNVPQPSFQDGQYWGYGFGINDPIPNILIPLTYPKQMGLDLGLAYQQTFENTPANSLRVNYEQLPENFHHYTKDDQAKIRAVMEQVQEKQKGGV